MKKTAAVLTAVTALLAVSSVSAQSSFTDDLKKSWQATKEAAADTWEKAKDATAETREKSADKASDAWSDAKKWLFVHSCG